MGLKEKIEDRIKLEANSKQDFINTMNSIGLLQWVLDELEKESDLKQEMLDYLDYMNIELSSLHNLIANIEIIREKTRAIIQKAKES